MADRFSSAGQGDARPFHPAPCNLLSGQLLSARPGVARFLTRDAGLVSACSKTTCKAGRRRASLSNTLISKMETETGSKYLAWVCVSLDLSTIANENDSHYDI